jgi:hypothetical protein
MVNRDQGLQNRILSGGVQSLGIGLAKKETPVFRAGVSSDSDF